MWYTNIYTGKILKHIKIKKQKTDSRGKEGPSISDRLVSHFPVLHTVTANHSHTLPPTPCLQYEAQTGLELTKIFQLLLPVLGLKVCTCWVW